MKIDPDFERTMHDMPRSILEMAQAMQKAAQSGLHFE